MMRLILLFTFSFSLLALEPSDYRFYEFSGGNYLDLKTSNVKNSIQYGSGVLYKSKEKLLFNKTLSKRSNKLQWDLRDLSNNKSISISSNPNKLFYGASLSKVFVASAFMNITNEIDYRSRQELNDLIVKSSNTAWGSLQKKIGQGDDDLGRQGVQSFLNNLCIYNSIGFRGYLGKIHGNEINVTDVSRYIQASFDGEYGESKEIFKLLFISRTGKARLKKYFPSSMIIGGKTGTYKGNTSIDGKPVVTDSKHHLIVFKYKNKYYSLTVLSDGIDQEVLSVLAYGLFQKYLNS